MRFTRTVNVTGEVEIDVDLADVITDIETRCYESEPHGWRQYTGAINALYSILDKMQDSTIDAMPIGMRQSIHDGLARVLKRFETAGTKNDHGKEMS